MPSSTDELRSFLEQGSTGGRRKGGGDRRSNRSGSETSDRRVNRSAESSPDISRDDMARPFGGASERPAETRPLLESEPAHVDPAHIDPAHIDPAHIDLESTPVAAVPRANSTLQKAWIDPEETPFTPVPRPGNPLTARVIAWVGVLAFLVGLGWLIIPELDFRLTSLETVELSDGVLTAQPVQLSPLRPSIVSELYVDASSLPDGVLPEGTPIALLESTSQDGTRIEANEITVPFDARFVSVDTLVGGVVMPGTPVATLYDPAQMYVIVTVQPELLDVMRRGMRARLVSEVAGVEIEGVVISAVPLLGTDHEPTTANLVNIRIKPDADAVADLVPGIRFDAIIDLASADPASQPLVFTYAGHVSSDGSAAVQGAPVGE